MVPEIDTQRQLTDLRQRIKILEDQLRQDKPEGAFMLKIGSQSFAPSLVKTGAGFGVRYLSFQLEGSDGYDQIMDDLMARVVQETTYIENGEVILRGKTIEIWQDLRNNDFWWAKVEVDAFT